VEEKNNVLSSFYHDVSREGLWGIGPKGRKRVVEPKEKAGCLRRVWGGWTKKEQATKRQIKLCFSVGKKGGVSMTICRQRTGGRKKGEMNRHSVKWREKKPPPKVRGEGNVSRARAQQGRQRGRLPGLLSVNLIDANTRREKTRKNEKEKVGSRAWRESPNEVKKKRARAERYVVTSRGIN